MKNNILTLIFLLITITTSAQNKMENKFITWDNFVENFGKEMVSAEDVFNNMVKNGLKNNTLTKMDFTFVSDEKENLIKLGEFIKTHYPYTIQEVKRFENLWEINGETNEFPMTSDNLLYWALDMYKRGYEFDATLEAYGGLANSKTAKFPITDISKTDFYFDKGIECYNNGDLSGAIFNWTLTIEIDPKDPNAYYSRAIVKNELYTWKSALKDYDEAIKIAPNFVSALINRGGLKDENEDYQGAIVDYETVLKLDKLEAEEKQQAYFNLGNTYYNLKDKKKACENWKKALENGAEYAKERIKEYCK
ncbi:Tetratricopeptide TPR_1 repeat-containing protein [Pseudopedobacter saltans DSM 12145]|uniref:Tetratricopeptide TPR_1 repeat-containing protein n=1 Tax=Pseudopedobacter saltans (strain ATCC 51119 / DSM 12145 / JCM 21818 / CCUG 39354 / LMG 10337 / NBRC 100064 / NCIMB 13643) TaxID=762903 RepID=F0S7D4_PSESL|nr:tetratricopeptide repeat protein [Pseudopedobacter saltans]ADY51159.1 Tetratricopeptide TPR_1 repeat-containing protein [Pseudopedobacter saltans DSM 12145]